MHGRSRLGLVMAQISQSDQSLVASHVVRDQLGGPACIELIGAFGCDPIKGVGQVALDQPVAGPPGAPIGLAEGRNRFGEIGEPAEVVARRSSGSGRAFAARVAGSASPPAHRRSRIPRGPAGRPAARARPMAAFRTARGPVPGRGPCPGPRRPTRRSGSAAWVSRLAPGTFAARPPRAPSHESQPLRPRGDRPGRRPENLRHPDCRPRAASRPGRTPSRWPHRSRSRPGGESRGRTLTRGLPATPRHAAKSQARRPRGPRAHPNGQHARNCEAHRSIHRHRSTQFRMTPDTIHTQRVSQTVDSTMRHH